MWSWWVVWVWNKSTSPGRVVWDSHSDSAQTCEAAAAPRPLLCQGRGRAAAYSEQTGGCRSGSYYWTTSASGRARCPQQPPAHASSVLDAARQQAAAAPSVWAAAARAPQQGTARQRQAWHAHQQTKAGRHAGFLFPAGLGLGLNPKPYSLLGMTTGEQCQRKRSSYAPRQDHEPINPVAGRQGRGAGPPPRTRQNWCMLPDAPCTALTKHNRRTRQDSGHAHGWLLTPGPADSESRWGRGDALGGRAELCSEWQGPPM